MRGWDSHMNRSMGERYVSQSPIIPLSQGFLYYGEDLSLKRKVILFTTENKENDAGDEYVRNFRKAASFTHDGFLHILDTGFDGQSVMVVLQNRPGKPLGQELKQRVWTFPQVIGLISDLGVSMLDAMEKQITGYSVSADNLWLNRDGRLSVINSWEDGPPQTQGAVGLCSLLIQLFSGTAEIPGRFEALDAHLSRTGLLEATAEQKDALVHLVRRVSQGQESLSSLVFGLRALPVGAPPAPVTERLAPPAAPVHIPAAAPSDVREHKPKSAPPAAKAAALPEDEEDDEEGKTPFYKKAIVGASAIIVAAFLVWMFWPTSKPDRQQTPGTIDSGKTTQESPTPKASTQPKPTQTPPSPSPTVNVGDPITIPNLVGLTQADAEKQALAFGLRYTYNLETNSQPQGTVFKQDLAAGTPGTKGGSITFWVSKGNPNP